MSHWPSEMQAQERAATEADAAHSRLTRDIIRGEFAPDAKLRIRELTERYGIGASPMREALARLSGRGLVRLEGQKGFRVAGTSRAELIDMTRSREILEAKALQLALEAADDLWEADLVRAFHLLELELGRRGDGSRAWLDAFEARHHTFHQALLAACPLRTLKLFCDELYVRTERYRRLLFGYRFDTRDLAQEHRNLMDAAISRDVSTATAMIVSHIGLTSDLLSSLLPDDDRAAAQQPVGPRPTSMTAAA